MLLRTPSVLEHIPWWVLSVHLYSHLGSFLRFHGKETEAGDFRCPGPTTGSWRSWHLSHLAAEPTLVMDTVSSLGGKRLKANGCSEVVASVRIGLCPAVPGWQDMKFGFSWLQTFPLHPWFLLSLRNMVTVRGLSCQGDVPGGPSSDSLLFWPGVTEGECSWTPLGYHPGAGHITGWPVLLLLLTWDLETAISSLPRPGRGSDPFSGLASAPATLPQVPSADMPQLLS